MSTKKRNIVDYVYLSELDSVRTSADEQLAGERALFKALVYEGKAVVLTYNQIVDSTIFLHCIRSKEAFTILLNFFKDGRLLVNQFKENMNLSKYIQENYSPKNSFKSSYFSFLEKYDDNTKTQILNGLIDSIKYGDDVFLKTTIPNNVYNEDKEELCTYIKFILTINTYMYEYNCYVYSKSTDKLDGHYLTDYLIKICDVLEKYNKIHSNILRRIINLHTKRKLKDTRSVYYNIAEELIYSSDLKVIKKYIDVAYNNALEYSISVINQIDHIENDILEILSNHISTHDTSLVSVKENWNGGYRMTSITSYIFYKINYLKWKYLLFACPLVEILRILLSLALAFALMWIVDIFSGVEQLWISSSLAILITFIYNYCIDLIEDKFIEKLPEWCSTNAFSQIKNFLKDLQILKQRNK